MDQPAWATSKLLLSADDLAGLLSVSRATLWRWVSAGRVPGPILRNGQVVRWSRAKIDAWIVEGCPNGAEADAG